MELLLLLAPMAATIIWLVLEIRKQDKSYKALQARFSKGI